jgi:BirA family biotin operon repressor/biotin-[acetyl-CoA-carboxylase] ligase
MACQNVFTRAPQVNAPADTCCGHSEVAQTVGCGLPFKILLVSLTLFADKTFNMTPDAKLLSALRAARHAYIAISDLAAIVGESPVRVVSRLCELRRLGFKIEEQPHAGWRLVASPDALLPDDLRSRLGAKTIGSEILVLGQTDSTNTVVGRMAANGAREGLVVFAESQTNGRGRMGRGWVSPKGKGLWFSVLVRPRFAPFAVTRLTILTAVAVAKAARELTGIDARIKWPNDILVNGRKIAGILTELLSDADTIQHAIIGVGVNVRCAPQDFPPQLRPFATSLEYEARATFSRPELAARILSLMDAYYAKAQGHFEEIVEEWASLSSSLGKRICVAVGARRFEGTALALDGSGALLVRCDDGRIEKIVGGDLVSEKTQG